MAEISFHTTYSDKQYLLSRAKNGSESGLRSGVSYRFGFNGKENDNEVKGTGNQQDYGMRIYDPRIARFLSADPLIVQEQKYPELSPYQFASNRPIDAIDLDGLEARSYLYIYLDNKPIYRLATYYETNGWRGDGTITTKWYVNKGQISSHYSYSNGKQTVSKQLYKYNFGGFKKEKSFSWTDFMYSLDHAIRGKSEDFCEGHSDPAVTGKLTQKDWTVGLGIVGAMTGIGAALEAGTLTLVGAVSLLNSIDDVLGWTVKGNGSLMYELTPDKYKAYTSSIKTIAGALSTGVNTKEIIKNKDYDKAMKFLSTLLDAAGTEQNAKSTIDDTKK